MPAFLVKTDRFRVENSENSLQKQLWQLEEQYVLCCTTITQKCVKLTF
jgi:hypothetical protein